MKNGGRWEEHWVCSIQYMLSWRYLEGILLWMGAHRQIWSEEESAANRVIGRAHKDYITELLLYRLVSVICGAGLGEEVVVLEWRGWNYLQEIKTRGCSVPTMWKASSPEKPKTILKLRVLLSYENLDGSWVISIDRSWFGLPFCRFWRKFEGPWAL